MLTHQHAAGGATLTLERAERGNALGPELVEALITQVGLACADPGTHKLVRRASGRHFCTGLDLSERAPLSDGDLLLRLVRIETLLSMVWHVPLRTAVLAQGRTWGAGADLFAACEHRVAAAGTTFRFPGARFGIVLGTRRLAERIGVDAARRLVLEGGELDASQALAAGLLDRVADVVELPAPKVEGATAAAVRAATRADQRDADLAALVRSAAVPGLHARIAADRGALLRT